MKYIAFLILLCLSCVTLKAQDLEKIGTKKPLKVTGGVSTSHILYGISGIESRRDPYTYYASGNLNFDVYGWSVPFSFSVSNQQTTFQQPFNQYSLHPKYKWVTAHIGWNSGSFSPYTLSGHAYNGIGLDLVPKDWLTINLVYGRFQKAVKYDTTSAENPTASFRRMGYGLKTAIKRKGFSVDFNIFKGKDKENSIGELPDSLGILPEENLALGIHVQKQFLQKFSVDLELAGTSITEDTRVARGTKPKNIFAYTGPLYKPNQSSTFYKAFKSNVSYNHKLFTVGFGYERVEPEYRTLGGYFFNNDLENITTNFSTQFFKQRVNISTNIGVQRNDILNQKGTQMRRLATSLNLSVNLSKKLNTNLSYSNFQSFTNVRSSFDQINQVNPLEQLDTLNYRQISQNANANLSYAIKSSKVKSQNLNLSLSYQVSNGKRGEEAQPSSKFYNFNTSYSHSINEKNFTMSAAFNINKSESETTSSTFGPTFSVNLGLFSNKVKSALSLSLNNSYQNKLLSNSIVNLRWSNTYTLAEKHNFNMSLVSVRRNQSRDGTKAFTEYTSTLGYSYSF